MAAGEKGRTRDGFEWPHAVGWAATRMEVAVGTVGSGASHLRQQRKANHAMGGSPVHAHEAQTALYILALYLI